jgi:hypothetical protein
VWARELPWQAAPLSGAGELGNGSSGTPDLPEATAGATGQTDADADAATPEAPEATPAPAAAPRSRETAADPGAPEPEEAEAPRTAEDPGGPQEERPSSRISFTKPMLAGAAGLCALLLTAPALIQDKPAHPRQSETFDTAEGSSPQHPNPSSSSAYPLPDPWSRPRLRPSPGATHGSGSTKSGTGRAGDPPRLENVGKAMPVGSPLPGSRRTVAKPRTTPAAQHWTTTVVSATSVLEPGQSWSTNRVVLAFQGDGNLVLYDKKGHPLWWSGTVGQGARTVFQADGNLVVYTRDMQTAWSSRTDGHDGARLVLQDDGNMVIQYGRTALWSTHTAM